MLRCDRCGHRQKTVQMSTVGDGNYLLCASCHDIMIVEYDLANTYAYRYAR